MSSSLPRPEFFLDRTLGRRIVAAGLRDLGWSVVTHHELFGDRDQDVDDVEWIDECSRRGSPVLSNDKRIRYRPAEIAAIRSSAVRIFVLSSGSLKAEQQVELLHRHRDEILELAALKGPLLCSVQMNRVVRRPL